MGARRHLPPPAHLPARAPAPHPPPPTPQACTGSGKPLAFVIPVVERLLRLGAGALAVNQVGGIILSPTRELAGQTLGVVQLFTAGTGLSAALLVGGSDVAADVARCSTGGCNPTSSTSSSASRRSRSWS